jgi:6-phosphogluconolactonase
MHGWLVVAAAGAALSMAAVCLAAEPAPAPSSAPAAKAEPVTIYVGTYTGARSKGIYMVHMDPATGALAAPELAAESTNPSFLALDPTNRFLYAVNEVDNFGGKKSGSVSAFAILPDGGKLKALNQQPSGGTSPCHVAVDPAGKNVLVANYSSGSVEVLPIGKDGSLAAPSEVIQDAGSGPNKGRQEGPHAHCIGFDPAGHFVLACDLGIDKVLVYRFDAAKGKLTANQPPSASVAAGAGARHFAFHPSGRFVYVISELNSSVTAFAYDAAHGSMKVVQEASSLPAGAHGTSAAEVAVHPSGKFLYATNRGPSNTIAIFAIDPETGKLTPAGSEPSQGGGPRHFAIDPTGTFLIVANQDANNLVVFRIDPTTGGLKATGSKVDVGAAVCVTFVPPAK